MSNINDLLDRLPDLNRGVVLYVVNYLQILALPQNQQETKMGVQNLAIVFGPNFLRNPSEDAGTILESQRFEQNFVVGLIKHLNTNRKAVKPELPPMPSK